MRIGVQMVDNIMADDWYWEEEKPKKCKICGLVSCVCEDNDDE